MVGLWGAASQYPYCMRNTGEVQPRDDNWLRKFGLKSHKPQSGQPGTGATPDFWPRIMGMRFLPGLALLFVMGCTPTADTSASTSTPSTTNATESGTTGTSSTTPEQQTPPKKTKADQLVNQDESIDKGLPKTAAPGAKMPKDGDAIAILTTNQGRIVVKFFPEVAPNHVKNFLDLAGKKFYDGTKFHRVIPGFMIQGGDPNTKSGDPSSWGTGGPGYNVKAEFNDVLHTPGILSMARTGDPDGAGSQFFIMHARYPSLDHQYSVFGQVIEGMDVVNKIATTETGANNRPVKDQVLEKVEVTKWPVKLAE